MSIEFNIDNVLFVLLVIATIASSAWYFWYISKKSKTEEVIALVEETLHFLFFISGGIILLLLKASDNPSIDAFVINISSTLITTGGIYFILKRLKNKADGFFLDKISEKFSIIYGLKKNEKLDYTIIYEEETWEYINKDNIILTQNIELRAHKKINHIPRTFRWSGDPVTKVKSGDLNRYVIDIGAPLQNGAIPYKIIFSNTIEPNTVVNLKLTFNLTSANGHNQYVEKLYSENSNVKLNCLIMRIIFTQDIVNSNADQLFIKCYNRKPDQDRFSIDLNKKTRQINKSFEAKKVVTDFNANTLYGINWENITLK